MQNRDQIAADEIRIWLESRKSERTAWKKVSNLASTFGVKRLTSLVKQRISEALSLAGIELEPTLDDLSLHDTVTFHLVDSHQAPKHIFRQDQESSDKIPNQIVTWHAKHILPEPDGFGQWLVCLKSTLQGDRQFVWEGSSGGRGIVGIVTFSGSTRNEGRWEGWGVHELFDTPISRTQLLNNPVTTTRFDSRGIKALQGLPISLDERTARAIANIRGGIHPTAFPISEPDPSIPPDKYSRDDLPLEIITQIAIFENQYLWEKIGLHGQPRWEVKLGSAGRVDLLSGNTVIEVKKSVNVNVGPGQIERYLKFMTKQKRLGPASVRGILVQTNDWLAPGVRERLGQSEFPIELWSVDKGKNARWKAIRLL